MLASSWICFCLATLPPIAPQDGPGAVVEPSAKLEKLWDEGSFTEGGAKAADGAILFSDIGDRIMRFDPKTGQTTVFREPGGRSNGMIFDPQGRLIVAEGANTGGNRRVTITEPDGRVRVLAEGYQGKRFNSPNDVAVDSKGRVYVTDPRYVGDEPRELDFEGVFRIDPDGRVALLETTAKKPNGILVSPDEKTLYVADNGPAGRTLLALDLSPEGEVSRPRVLHDFGASGGIDGMTATTDGRIVAGVPSGVLVLSTEGQIVAQIPVPDAVGNVEFGGDDDKDLYIMAGKSLYRIRTNMTGFRVGEPKRAECLLNVRLPKATYERGEKIIPEIEYANQSGRDLSIWSSGFWPNHKVIVKDEAGNSPPLTAKGKQCRDAFAPGGDRDKNSPIIVEAGKIRRAGAEIDVASLFELDPGKQYALEIVYDDRQEPTPLKMNSRAVKFEVR